LRSATFLIGVLASFCAAIMGLAVSVNGSEVVSRVRKAEHICLVARLLMHIVCIVFDGDSTFVFLKLVSLWIHPLSSAKETNSSPQSFKMYLAVHNALVLVRFRHDWEGGAPWIICTMVVDRMLLDWQVSKQERRRSREELSLAHVCLEQMAEVTTKRLFDRFCDATVMLNADLDIVEPTPRMAAMLGKQGNMVGRTFSSLIDTEDLQAFADHMEKVKRDLQENPGDPVHSESVQVRLLDAFAKPVPVHVFHAGFKGRDKKPVYFLGLSETWRPPRNKTPKLPGASRSNRLGTAPATASSGSLLSSTELLQSPRASSVEPPPTTSSSPSSSDMPSAGSSRLGSVSSHRRSYSPRPIRSTSLPR